MRKKMAQRRPWFLWIGGACFLVGSLVAGSVGFAASAGAPNFTANQGSAGSSSWPVTASQGTGTGSGGAWKVDGSGVTQPVSGTVGVSNLPATQNVSIDPSHNSVSVSNLPAVQNVSVSNLPATQNVSITGKPTVVNGDTTTVFDKSLENLSPGATQTVFSDDTSSYREVTLYMYTGGIALANNVSCTATYNDAFSSLTVTLAQFTLSNAGNVETFDPAPPSLTLSCTNSDTAYDIIIYNLAGRAN
jgi:hypothetical protein